MSEWNPRPTGTDAETDHHREVYRQANSTLPMRSTSQYSVQRRTTGTSLRLKMRPGGSPAKMAFELMEVIDMASYDTLMCRPDDAPDDGSLDVKVAVLSEQRNIGSEYIDGELWTYDYPDFDILAQTRTATGPSGEVVQVMTPRWQIGQKILVADCNNTGIILEDGTPVTKIAITPRAWAEKYTVS